MRRHIAAGVLAALCVGLAVGVVNVQVASAQPLTSAVTGVADEQSDAIVNAAAARLDVMPDVAYTKYRLNLPVEDLVREKQAEDAFVASATARGIDAQVARNVIRDQMVASKMVQYELISKWKVTPPPVRPYKDLAKELRPVIDAETARLTSGLADAVATGIPADWRTQVQRSADSAARSLDVAVSRAALDRSLVSIAALS
jgi:chorismate mutase